MWSYPSQLGNDNLVIVSTTFLGKIRLLADRNKLSTLLRESLYSSLPQFLNGFQALNGYHDTWIQLSIELVYTIRHLQRLVVFSDSRFKREVLARLYLPLEYSIVASGHNAEAAQTHVVDQFLLDFFCGVGSVPGTAGMPRSWSPMPAVGHHPRLVRYILSRLGGTSSSHQAIWLRTISGCRGDWFRKRRGDIWLELGLARQVLAFVQHSTDSSVVLEAVKLMAYLNGASGVWNRKFLDKSTVDAVLDASARFHECSYSSLGCSFLELLLQLWSSSDETSNINWASSSLLVTLRRLLPEICQWSDFDPIEGTAQRFLDYLMEHRSEAAFIACQLDVAINSTAQFGEKYRWNYILYQDARPSALCCRPMHIHDDLL